MGWQVAVLFDVTSNLDSLRIVVGQMPLWAVATEERKIAQKYLVEEFRLFWVPEPAFTVFALAFPNDPIAGIIDLIPTLAEHHPRLSGISLFGVDISDRLQREMQSLGYDPVPDPNSTYPDRLRFAKPLSSIPDVPAIRLDATGWQSYDSFYQAFFDAVGAPEWHGHNLNALNDSIGTGGINRIEVPYRVVICNATEMSNEAAASVRDLGDLIQHLQREGCPVDLVVE